MTNAADMPHNKVVLSRSQKLLALLAFMMMACAQVFGVTRGYICACTGGMSAAAACTTDTCAPHHELTAHGSCGMDGESHTACGGETPQPHEQAPGECHDEVRDFIQSITGLGLAALPPVLLAEQPVPLFDFGRTAVWEEPDASLLDTEEAGGSPPTAELVAKSVVRLV